MYSEYGIYRFFTPNIDQETSDFNKFNDIAHNLISVSHVCQFLTLKHCHLHLK